MLLFFWTASDKKALTFFSKMKFSFLTDSFCGKRRQIWKSAKKFLHWNVHLTDVQWQLFITGRCIRVNRRNRTDFGIVLPRTRKLFHSWTENGTWNLVPKVSEHSQHWWKVRWLDEGFKLTVPFIHSFLPLFLKDTLLANDHCTMAFHDPYRQTSEFQVNT